ncbi:carboxylesterase NlhH [Ilyonectria robusta]
MSFPDRNSARRSKPCGPWDSRRKGHRCQNCRSSRLGCDGGRPCSRCQLRLLPCPETNETSERATVVFLGHSIGPVIPEAQVSSDRDAPYIDSFFAFMELNSSPFTDPFSRFRLAHFLDESLPVLLVVLSIGRARLHCIEATSYADPMKTMSWVPAARNKIRHNLQTIAGTVNPSPETKSLILALTMLSCIFELMIDSSGYGAILVLESLPMHVVQSLHIGPLLSQFDIGLLAGYQYIQAAVCLICDQDTFLAGIQFCEPGARSELSQNLDTTAACRLSRLLVLLARCNARSIQWLEQARRVAQAEPTDVPKPASLQEILGPSLLEFGNAVFENAIEVLELADNIRPSPIVDPVDPQGFSSPLTAFYHCAIISVARLFTDTLWGAVGKTPAADEMPHLESHALIALAVIERKLVSVGAESVFYLPLITTIALEIRQKDDKRRVMKILNDVALTGFVVARTYKSDMQLAWDLIKN